MKENTIKNTDPLSRSSENKTAAPAFSLGELLEEARALDAAFDDAQAAEAAALPGKEQTDETAEASGAEAVPPLSQEPPLNTLPEAEAAALAETEPETEMETASVAETDAETMAVAKTKTETVAVAVAAPETEPEAAFPAKTPDAGTVSDPVVQASPRKKGLSLFFLILTLLLAVCLAGAIFFLYRENRTAQTLARTVSRYENELENQKAQQDELEAQVSQLEQTLAQTESPLEQLPELPFTVDFDAWNYILVNETNLLPQEHEVTLQRVQNGQYVDERIADDLNAMLEDASDAGLPLLLCSSYRTYEKQDQLVKNSIRDFMRKGMTYKDAFFETRRTIALTGASEHHTGLALDIVGKSHQSLDAAQANTKEAKWLKANAYRYGFILRYPADKTELTGIDFESWHYRYVGREAAAYITENNLCLEEFLELARLRQTE